jgi:hypothetical protein
MAKEATCIKAISGFSPYQSNTFASVITCGGVWEGTTGPRGLWNDVYDPPDGPNGPPPHVYKITGYLSVGGTGYNSYILNTDFTVAYTIPYVSASDGALCGTPVRVADGWICLKDGGSAMPRVVKVSDAGVVSVLFTSSQQGEAAGYPSMFCGVVKTSSGYVAMMQREGARSADGVNWTAITYIATTTAGGPCTDGTSVYEMANTASHPLSSQNTFEKTSDLGNNWSQVVLYPFYSTYFHIGQSAYKNGTIVFVCGANDGSNVKRCIMYSTNSGASFSGASNYHGLSHSNNHVRVVSNANVFVTAEGNGGMLYSSDGITWSATSQTITPDSLSYGGDGYIYGYDGSTTKRTLDGNTWSTVAHPYRHSYISAKLT